MISATGGTVAHGTEAKIGERLPLSDIDLGAKNKNQPGDSKISSTDAAKLSQISTGNTPKEIGKAWMEIARDKDVFTLGETPTEKDMQGILDSFAGPMAKDIAVTPLQTPKGETWGYQFAEPNGRYILLDFSVPDEVYVNSALAGKRGTPIYQAIYAWAHNNGKTIVEDPAGLSDIGVLRRTSHMLSSALRFGTTEHIEPGPKSGIIEWRKGNSSETTQHNIGLLAMQEAKLVKERLPELADLRYNIDTQSFYDGNTRIPDEEVQPYFRKRIGAFDRNFARGAGEKTFRRALATLAAEGSGRAGGNRWLVGNSSETPTGLKKILYSKAKAGENTVDVSTAFPAVREIAKTFKEQMPGGPQVEVVRDINGLGNYDKETLSSLQWDRPEAFYDSKQDKVVLVADHFSPGKGESLDHYVQRKILHEASGHGGMARLFNGKLSSQYGNIISGLQKQLGARDFGTAWNERHGYRNLQELAKAYRFDMNTPEGLVNTIEEHLAHMAEEAQTPTWFDHTVAKITELLRAAGFNTWTDADTRILLQKAHREVFAN